MTYPRVGISACLLGQRVRHNGEHKGHHWLIEEFSKFVTWVPLCPEVEMGLGVPRDTLRLIGEAIDPKMIVVKTGKDLTALAKNTARTLLKRETDFDSYIFKKDSPSCGLQRVKVYGKSAMPLKTGVGLFAAAVKSRYPLIPMIEEGRLADPDQREAFAIQVFACFRLKNLPRRVSALQKFHQSYKFLLMSLDPINYQKLGAIAANSSRKPIGEVFEIYLGKFNETLQKPRTVKRRTNALQHLFGYLKTKIGSAEKKQVLDVIEDYRKEEIPLIAPLTLLHHLARKHSVTYLLDQEFFQPYPKGLKI